MIFDFDFYLELLNTLDVLAAYVLKVTKLPSCQDMSSSASPKS